MESGGQYDLLQRYLETDRMKARNLVVNVAVSALIDMRRLVFFIAFDGIYEQCQPELQLNCVPAVGCDAKNAGPEVSELESV